MDKRLRKYEQYVLRNSVTNKCKRFENDVEEWHDFMLALSLVLTQEFFASCLVLVFVSGSGVERTRYP